MRAPVLEPSQTDASAKEGRWMVVLFNDDFTPMDDVVEILMTATECSVNEAYTEMWEAHHFGKAPVHFASVEECHRVAAVIGSIGLKTEVAPEWID